MLARNVLTRRRVLIAAALLLVLLGIVLATSSRGSNDQTDVDLSATPALTPDDSGTDAPTAPDPAEPTADAKAAALQKLAKLGQPIFCAGTSKRMVALTFDDGPGPYTHYVLKRLRRNNMKATFFLVSRNLQQYGDLVPKEMELADIGDHTQTHANLPTLSGEAIENEMSGAQIAIEAKTHQPVRLFRPPYGAHNPFVDSRAAANGMVQVLWTVDSRDSLGANYSMINHRVHEGLHPGAIILLHDNHGQTVRALPVILHEIKAAHLQAVTLSELLTADPPTDEQLRAGPRGCGDVEPIATGSG